MRQILTIALLSVIVIADQDDDEFMKFIAKHNKSYKEANELARRKNNWKTSQWKVASLNASNPDATFELNFTADLDPVEYARMQGLRPDQNSKRMLEDESEDEVESDEEDESHRHLQSASIDYSVRGTGNVGPVKDQGWCGSCWAFAASSPMEGVISLKKSRAAGVFVPPVRLSEQQTVDCTRDTAENLAMFGKTYGQGGCNGGWMSGAWDFSRDFGSMTDADYPYQAIDGACRHDASKIVAKAISSSYIPASSALNALQNGPLAIAISAGNDVFQFYKSGIVTAGSGCPTAVDHGVTIVGYDVEKVTTQMPDTTTTTTSTKCRKATTTENRQKKCSDGGVYNATLKTCCTTTTTTTTVPGSLVTVEYPYWKIQNSWSSGWGDQGFIKFSKVDSGAGVCGMNQYIMAVDAQ